MQNQGEKIQIAQVVTSPALFPGGGEMGERIRTFDWSHTSLGPIAQWPQSLKTAVHIMLTSRQPIWLGWGKDLIKMYNDPYRAIVGGKHPRALGQPVSVVWQEISTEIEPLLKKAMGGVEGIYVESQLLIMERNGYREETYYTFSYSPIPDDQGNAGGIICANTDDTQRIIGERQLALLRELASSTASARTLQDACTLAAGALRTNARDLPFAMIYLLDDKKQELTLAGNAGIDAGHRIAPARHSLDDTSVWPFADVLRDQKPRIVDMPSNNLDVPAGAWPRAPSRAIVFPLALRGQSDHSAFLVAGLNPFRLFDESYSSFIDLVAAQIASSINNAQAYADERKRAETLAEVDRVKTRFFANVSHELRTPLTLMLGPIEDELRNHSEGNARLELAHRNTLRLLKLVNTLLDFSRLEAGRLQAMFEPVDLATFTEQLASQFRSAIEKAGLQLNIRCAPLPDSVHVDRDMWEKIVLNLLSNALKFTFRGAIDVELTQRGDNAELRVSDTGTGIPTVELSKIFDRFHRVDGASSRTHEGTGIGLALVKELTQLHGGDVSVESEINKGTTFTVHIPAGTAHLPKDRIGTRNTAQSATAGAKGFLSETDTWLGTRGAADTADVLPDAQSPRARPRIVLADDNADMRDYIVQLLRPHYEVLAVGDGRQALDAALAQKPDLVLSDVMMPGLDGFGLVRELRAHTETRGVPVILLSARAGEESRAEGIEEGADDYLVKPFSARELLARVQTHVRMAQYRRNTEQRITNILHSMTDGFHVIDAEGRFLEFNEAARRLFAERGMDVNEMIGKKLFDVFPAARSVGTGFALQHTLDTGVPTTAEDFFAAWQRWFGVRHFPAADGGVATFFQDITERKQLEAGLRESRERLSAMFEQATVGILVTDRDGRVLEANPSVCQILGHEEGSMHKAMLESLLHPEDCERNLPGIRAVSDGEMSSLNMELRFTHRSGRPLWVNVSVSPLLNVSEQIDRVLVIVQDIDARKRAEDSMQEHARTLETLNRVGSTLSAELDTQTILQTVTDAATQLSGAQFGAFFFNAINRDGESYVLYTLSGVPREAFAKFELPRNTPIFAPTFSGERVVRSDDITLSPLYGQMSPHHGMPKGHLPVRSYLAVPVISRNGTVLGGLFFGHSETGVFSAESERLVSGLASFASIALDNARLYQTTLDSEQRFRMLADNISQLAWTCGSELGNVTWYNQRWLDYTGLTQQEVKGWDWSKVQHPDHLARVVEGVKRAAASGEPWEDTFPLLGADGAWRWFLSRAVPIRDDEGKITAWFGTNTDISDQRVVEEALEEQRGALADLHRRKDEFLAMLSHELRNPLAAISNAVHLLRLQKQEDRLQIQARSIVERQVEQLGRLVDDLLEVARITSGRIHLHREEIDFNGIVRNSLEAVTPQIERRRHSVEISLPVQPTLLYADATRLEQVVVNLLTNATKYTEESGRISVALEHDGTDAVLRVRDNGIGLAAEDLRRIFEIFTQIDRSLERTRSGLGLGLALVKNLVELHGGQVEARSEGLGYGSEFIVRLPMAKVLQPQLLDSSVHAKASATKSRRILVVDDNRDSADSLAMLLMQLGHEVDAAYDGLEGVSKAATFNPDLVLLDIGMPKMNGYEAARHIRDEQKSRIVLVALSGWGRQEDLQRSQEAGFDGHLVKPVDLEKLTEMLDSLDSPG